MSPAHGHDIVSSCTGALPTTFPPQQNPPHSGCPQNPRPLIFTTWGLPSSSPRFELEGRAGAGSCGDREPLQGGLGLQGCGRDPAPTVSHTHVPPQLQLALRFCFAATAKQVLLGNKKALGQARRAVGIYARALAGCHLRVRANNAIWPWDRGTRNTTTAAQTPNTGSRLPEHSQAAPCPRGLCHPWLCPMATVAPALRLLPMPPDPGAGQGGPAGHCVPTGTLHRCHSALLGVL